MWRRVGTAVVIMKTKLYRVTQTLTSENHANYLAHPWSAQHASLLHIGKELKIA
jgi:hypothetical protein